MSQVGRTEATVLTHRMKQLLAQTSDNLIEGTH
jgi:hypothetical protein